MIYFTRKRGCPDELPKIFSLDVYYAAHPVPFVMEMETDFSARFDRNRSVRLRAFSRGAGIESDKRLGNRRAFATGIGENRLLDEAHPSHQIGDRRSRRDR